MTAPAEAHARRCPLLIVLSAPSGAGKTTLVQGLLGADPRIQRVTTCTTRPPRSGEQDGVDYHFLTAEDFAGRREAGEFLEHATVHGHCYGTLRSEVLDRLGRGADVLLNIDVQGATAVRAAAQQDPCLGRSLVTVFLTPPTFAELERRLRGRATDSEAVIQRRLEAARQEIDRWREFDYLLVSASIAEDRRRMQVLIEAERMRACRRGSSAGVMAPVSVGDFRARGADPRPVRLVGGERLPFRRQRQDDS